MENQQELTQEGVDEILDERKTAMVRADSSWLGPRRILNTLAIIGAGAAGLWTLLKFYPAALAFLAAFA